jgi:hypothetical protein
MWAILVELRWGFYVSAFLLVTFLLGLWSCTGPQL